MRKYGEDDVKNVLSNVLEFALEQLLIPGQVENYVLIVNLDDAGMSDIGVAVILFSRSKK